MFAGDCFSGRVCARYRPWARAEAKQRCIHFCHHLWKSPFQAPALCTSQDSDESAGDVPVREVRTVEDGSCPVHPHWWQHTPWRTSPLTTPIPPRSYCPGQCCVVFHLIWGWSRPKYSWLILYLYRWWYTPSWTPLFRTLISPRSCCSCCYDPARWLTSSVVLMSIEAPTMIRLQIFTENSTFLDDLVQTK